MSATTPPSDAQILSIFNLMKSTDMAKLRDIIPIESVSDSGNRSGVPTAQELASSPQGLAMHGFAAQRICASTGHMTPQSDITKDYMELASRLGSMGTAVDSIQKSVNDLIPAINMHSNFIKSFSSAVAKAEEDDKEKKKKEEELKKAEDEKKAKSKKEEDKDEVAKALRKARIALSKAEDEDDEDMKTSCCAKAQLLIKSADEVISKAEEDAEDDESEKKVEKARSEYKVIKAKYKSFIAKSATTATTADSGAKVLIDLQKSVDDLAKQQNISSNQLIQALMNNSAGGGAKNLGAGGGTMPPSLFAKSLAADSLNGILVKLEKSYDNGSIDDRDYDRVKSIANRAITAKSGVGDMATVVAEIEKSNGAVKQFFMV